MVNMLELMAVRTEQPNSAGKSEQNSNELGYSLEFSAELERELSGILPAQLPESEQSQSLELTEIDPEEPHAGESSDDQLTWLFNQMPVPEVVQPEDNSLVSPTNDLSATSNVGKAEQPPYQQEPVPVRTEVRVEGETEPVVHNDEQPALDSSNLGDVGKMQRFSLADLIAQKMQPRPQVQPVTDVEKTLDPESVGLLAPGQEKAIQSTLTELMAKHHLRGVSKADLTPSRADSSGEKRVEEPGLPIKSNEGPAIPKIQFEKQLAAVEARDLKADLSYHQVKDQSDSIIDQMTKSIAHGRVADGQYLKVQLKPEYLGEMSIKIEKTSQGCTVSINVESEAVKSVLSEKADQILAGFSNRLSVDQVIITNEPEGGSYHGSLAQQAGQHDLSGHNPSSGFQQQRPSGFTGLTVAPAKVEETALSYMLGENKVNVYV